MLHKNVVIGDNHYIQNWEPADATALAGLVVSSSDIGKVARQVDTKAFYLLINNSPVTWAALDNTTALASVNSRLATDETNITLNASNIAANAYNLKKIVATQNRLRAAAYQHPFASILAWKNY